MIKKKISIRKINKFRKLKNIEKSFIAGIVLSSSQVLYIKRNQFNLHNASIFLQLDKNILIKGLFENFSRNYLLLNKREIISIKRFLKKKNREKIKIIFIDEIFWLNNKIKISIHCAVQNRSKIREKEHNVEQFCK